jgi:flagellin-like protein
MKTLRKIRKNAKALSPVVASIILIAVTVAVSIAVAAWMGALTVGFMGSSSVNISSMTFQGTGDVEIACSVKNTGTKSVTVTQVRVNSAAETIKTGSDVTLEAGDTGTITITLAAAWQAGNAYKVDLYDSSGQVVGSYQDTAP